MLREPTQQECYTVAQRYLSHAVPSLHEAHRDFIARICAWNATKSRRAGDLDWADDVEEWHCAEYSQFAAQHPQAPTTAAYALAQLALTRVRAWVVLTLSATGPAGQVPRRQADDARMAAERLAQAQQLDLNLFAQELSDAFTKALGAQWRQQPAAKHLFERICTQQRVNKIRSLDDFHREVSGFMQDTLTLMVSICLHCLQLGKTDRKICSQEENLPPFDLGCHCQVHWEHDWVFDPRTASTPHLDASIEQWVQSNVKGGSIQVPSIQQMVAFEEARLLDEKVNRQSKLERLVCWVKCAIEKQTNKN